MVWKLVWQNSLELLFYIKKSYLFSLFFLAFWPAPACSLPLRPRSLLGRGPSRAPAAGVQPRGPAPPVPLAPALSHRRGGPPVRGHPQPPARFGRESSPPPPPVWTRAHPNVPRAYKGLSPVRRARLTLGRRRLRPKPQPHLAVAIAAEPRFRRRRSPPPLHLRRQEHLPELRNKVRITSVPFSSSLPLSDARTSSPEFFGRRRAAPPRGPSSSATLSRGQHAHRARLGPRDTPVPSLRPAVPYSTPTVSSPEPAMAPPPRLARLAARAHRRPLSPPWTDRPAPPHAVHGPRPGPALSRSATWPVKPATHAGPGRFAKSSLWFSLINPQSTQFKNN